MEEALHSSPRVEAACLAQAHQADNQAGSHTLAEHHLASHSPSLVEDRTHAVACHSQVASNLVAACRSLAACQRQAAQGRIPSADLADLADRILVGHSQVRSGLLEAALAMG